MANEVALQTTNDISRIERMAEYVAKSGLFGLKTKEQAVALMLVAEAEGRHPASAAQDYDIIQNKPCKKAEAMLRHFIGNGGKVEWHELTDKKADATFSHPAGGSARIDWTIDRAEKAGLANKDNWKKFPRPMLRSRVVSEGVRTVYPAATSGMYVPEEVQDFEPPKRSAPEPKPEAIDVESTPVVAVAEQKPLESDHPVLIKAKEEASKGTESYKAWWKANKHVQASLLPHKDMLKNIAAMVDDKAKPHVPASEALNDDLPDSMK